MYHLREKDNRKLVTADCPHAGDSKKLQRLKVKLSMVEARKTAIRESHSFIRLERLINVKHLNEYAVAC